ncbi:assimilatory sulfite reductase (NADPH) flavoprotein subunit [Bowmanella sp. JS7-9]|uniref:Sulfite reductase [NADPH] flavoprotein alpha-component n=1 Tax=Pseudobowmanella zhangzhouensis TaxID=1537679 RepID=A0ABW1XKZ4_9ALTE|nr:assimilatory sulfite reductase (NADPH) flavoprotein subunit [Bowmanella sp. JS7-9]TBX20548.1 sulfite reductase [NADPH] flavoprotein alpha-component [Bowmanella sp. JS7-9]
MTANLPLSLHPGIGLTEQQIRALTDFTQSANAQQLLWVSGYFAGLSTHAASEVPVPTVASNSITLLYGSQTGNARGVAKKLAEQLSQAGLTVNLQSMADYKPRSLKDESTVLVVVSTHGEGEAPDDAVELHAFLASKKAAKLPQVRYGVIGLGDSSYEFFCQTGKDFDARLTALGATSILPRLDADVDYAPAVAAWSEQLLAELAKSAPVSHTPSVAGSATFATSSVYGREMPFVATLLESQKITGRDSGKDVRHVEISLEGSGLRYQPGDALGVYFTNDTALVDELLELLKLDAGEAVSVAGKTVSLHSALTDQLELTQSYPTFVQRYAEQNELPELTALVQDKAALRVYLADKQIVDIVRLHPGSLSAQQLVDALRPLTPRLYSIASSQEEVDEEVHLTVARVANEVNGQPREGGASGFLTRRAEADQQIRVFVESNDNFRLPQDLNTPVVMIGPGTGIAPFRAFLQHRQAQQAQGKNWLFFGNPHFTQDFLYQTEIQSYVKDGLLSRVSLAFSRDQQEKIYVQHRILEQGAELWQWLQDGAHLYICGDANRMAKDVEQALLSVIEQHGQQTAEQAKEYLTALRKAKRFQKDVY